MIKLALHFLDLFLKPKTNSFSWLCALGTISFLIGAAFGLYFGFEYLAPLLGHVQTGMLLSGSLILLGSILMLAARGKKTTPVLNKTLDIFKEKTDDLHLKEFFDHNKELILVASLVTGVLLSLLPQLRRDKMSKKI
ncbi:hypothetical protein IM40_07485 [Candidatus Paracaedimonas acanthamoebae]|nr:hypothetical protein IM40_07485 [Candidatus Paracaedimonas acanthamoebae]